MVRDPGLEELLRTDLGDMPGLSEKPMFGGLCFMMNGNMMQFVREDGAMYRVGKTNEKAALDLPGTEAMYQRGVRKHGLVWLSGDQFDDDDTRRILTDLARESVQSLPPKE